MANVRSSWLNASRRSLQPVRGRTGILGRFESLESRRLLAITTFVNDNWFVTVNQGAPGLDAGDQVSNANDTIAPNTITATFGVDAFASIGAALAGTDASGTVNVLEGTYAEHVNVGTSVSILGPNAGVDPTGLTPSRVAEAVIDGSLNGSPFGVTADNVTIDGFTVTRGKAGGTDAGIWLSGASKGAQVRNNIITGNQIGVSANSDGASTIQRNLFDGNNETGPAGGTGIYSEFSIDLMVDGNEFKNHSENSSITFAQGAPGSHQNVKLTNNYLHDNSYELSAVYLHAVDGGVVEGNTISTTDAGANALSIAGGNSGIEVLHNVFDGSARGIRIVDHGPGPNSDVTIHFNSFVGNTQYGLKVVADGIEDGYTGGPLDASQNWWGSVTGPNTLANAGGLGSAIDDAGGVVSFRPWLVYGDSNVTKSGFQVPAAFTVTAGNDVSQAENDYTLLANAVGAVIDGQTITLSGHFDWAAPQARAAWALGNDAKASVADDYSILVPANVGGVTLTATSLGTATIQGPGDLATANLEGFLLFDGGDNKSWEISNLEIFDFDLGLGFFNGAGGTDAFENTKILGNHIRVATDLNATVASVDVNQNIGIHFSFGKNQEIAHNKIDFGGDGVSDGTNFATSVGMQSNTSGGDAYDGLSIHNNDLRVLNAQSTSPEVILGIWENGHAHASDVAVVDNSMTNLAAGNDPALNLQRAFRVTSHSSPTTVVSYKGNAVSGANLGMQWIAGSDFKGNAPVEVQDNAFSNVAKGILLQSNGVAHLTGNVFDQTVSVPGSVGLEVSAGSIVSVGGTLPGDQNIFKSGLSRYIQLTPGASPVSDDLDATGNLFGVTGSPSGIAASAMSLAQLFELEDKLVHQVDVATVGFITVVPGHVYVTPQSFLAPFTTDPQVQRGVDAAQSGDTVHVAAGTYVGEVALAGKDNLSLLGAGMDQSVLVGPHLSAANGNATLRFTNSVGSLVDGFTITRDGNTVAEWDANQKNHGVAFGGGSNNTLQFSKISGNRNGIILDNSSGNTIQNNLIDNNRTGFNIQDGANNNTVIENFITNNWTFGVIFVNSVATAAGNEFFNNSIAGNWNGQIEDQSLSGSGVRDFSGNWLGTNAVTKTSSNTPNIGYSGWIPIEFGGTAAPPGSAVAVGGVSSSKFDFSPWLESGADSDADPTNGFQGDFSTLHVDDDSAQAGSVARIQEGVDLVSGSTVIVHNGLYLESNITLDKALTIDGESRAGVIVAPAAEDDNNGSGNFVGVFQHGFLIQHSDVTIKDLTIDGEGNSLLTAGKNNYRAGIVTDSRLLEVYDNSTIDNVAVRHTYRRGIQLDSGTPADGKSTGNSISNSVVDDVILSYAIALFDSDGTISSNNISNAFGGIATNYIDGSASAPLAMIRGNTIGGVREGIQASGLADGSIIGGPLATDGNHITLPTDANADTGIIVQYAVGQVTVQRNQISGSGADAGIWLFHNENKSSPVMLRQNSLSSAGSTAATAGDGTGIFLTDDGDLFGDEDGDSYAVLAGNSITGFARGIDLFRNGDEPAGGRNVVATIGGAAPADNNTLANNATAIRVYEVDAAANGGRLAVATVLNNNLSLVGNGIGVDVDGGSAALTNNRISSNDTGVLVRNAGVAKLQGNDLRNNSVAGLQIESGAIVDAGQVGTTNDYTGLGASTGGNNFATYIAGLGQPRAIVNANSAAPNQLAGAQGAPHDVSAEGNTFWSATAADIEAVVDHDLDNPLVGLVDFADPVLGTLATGTVSEGAPYSLSVSFAGASTNHKVTINWGDGIIDEIPVAPGVFTITPSHTYVDDNPTATTSDVYSISVTVEEVLGGGSDSDTTSVTVNNVAPTLTGLAATSVNEGGVVHLTGNIVDPGTADTFTLVVNWGDGLAPQTFSGVPATFDLTHTYKDDNPTLTNNDNYTISVTVTDDDTSSGSASTTTNVANVAPTVSKVALTSAVNEGGQATLSGNIADPGTEDTFTLTVNWGDGSAPQNFTYAAGTTSFSEVHTYVDDNPTATAADNYAVTFTLADDDSGQDTGGGTVAVSNVAATLSGVTLTPAINENGTVTLSGGIVDPGVGDTFKLVVDWGDGSPAQTFNYPAGTTTFSETHQYLDDKPSVTTSDAYTVTLTLTDDDSGTASTTKSVTVSNVAPQLTNISLGSPIAEGSSASLSFDIVDPGSLDTFVLVVNWGDGSGPQNYNLPAGTTTYSLSHSYPDDNPTGTASDVYSVSLAITDDDFGADSESRSLTVQNAVPVVSAGADTTVDLGYAFTRSGSFTDLGVNDTFSATVDYGDGTGVQPLALTGTSFSLSHNYLSAGARTVTVTVTDDDGGIGTDTVLVNVTNLAPTADIIDVTPDPRNTSVSTIQIVFSEPVTGFTLADLNLDRNLDGLGNLLSGGQSLATSDNITFTLSGLSSITASGGFYNLHLAAATSGITDIQGNALTANANETWTSTAVDSIAPTADIVDVSPDPRSASVSTLTVVFSEPVVGVSLGDFSLDRNGDGKGNLLPLSWFAPTVTISTIDNRTYTINGLDSRTASNGHYVAFLTATGSGIADLAGNLLVTNAQDQWDNNSGLDADPPIVDIIDVSPDPRTTSVNSIQITFYEPVTGFGLNDLNLDRQGDGLGNLLTGAQTLTTSDNITWTLGNLASITSANGTYSLTLSKATAGITDFSGHSLAIDGYDKWTKVAAMAPVSEPQSSAHLEAALGLALEAAIDDDIEQTLDLLFSH